MTQHLCFNSLFDIKKSHYLKSISWLGMQVMGRKKCFEKNHTAQIYSPSQGWKEAAIISPYVNSPTQICHGDFGTRACSVLMVAGGEDLSKVPVWILDVSDFSWTAAAPTKRAYHGYAL